MKKVLEMNKVKVKNLYAEIYKWHIVNSAWLIEELKKVNKELNRSDENVAEYIAAKKEMVDPSIANFDQIFEVAKLSTSGSLECAVPFNNALYDIGTDIMSLYEKDES